MVKSDLDNANTLNAYAWRMAELKQNLEDALNKAQKGVSLSENAGKPMIMDTEAEILWLLGRTNEAIEVINHAIKIEPDDEYYKEQLEKFKLSL